MAFVLYEYVCLIIEANLLSTEIWHVVPLSDSCGAHGYYGGCTRTGPPTASFAPGCPVCLSVLTSAMMRLHQRIELLCLN
jgi:hypothetical protein